MSDQQPIKQDGEAQPMETEATTPVDSPMVVEANGDAEMEREQPPQEEKKEVLVIGLDYGTQKCVMAVTKSAEMFPAIVQNNLANKVTPYVVQEGGELAFPHHPFYTNVN
jgi:hypothetical protein